MTHSAATPTKSAPLRHVPGQSAMWVFVLGDLFIFAGWFIFYMAYRANDPATFLESQRALSQSMGVVNTLILLTSSLFMALSVNAARERRYELATGYTVATLVLGVAFMVGKLYEWVVKFGDGVGFTTNDFFVYYFFLTAIHMFHVTCGFIVLGVVIRELRNPAFRSQEIVETGATYWHMVDLLWVLIFALLYLSR